MQGAEKKDGRGQGEGAFIGKADGASPKGSTLSERDDGARREEPGAWNAARFKRPCLESGPPHQAPTLFISQEVVGYPKQ